MCTKGFGKHIPPASAANKWAEMLKILVAAGEGNVREAKKTAREILSCSHACASMPGG
jgi:hypothetical protein